MHDTDSKKTSLNITSSFWLPSLNRSLEGILFATVNTGITSSNNFYKSLFKSDVNTRQPGFLLVTLDKTLFWLHWNFRWLYIAKTCTQAGFFVCFCFWFFNIWLSVAALNLKCVWSLQISCFSFCNTLSLAIFVGPYNQIQT